MCPVLLSGPGSCCSAYWSRVEVYTRNSMRPTRPTTLTVLTEEQEKEEETMPRVRLEDLWGSLGTNNNQSTGSWLSAWDWQRGPQSLMLRERALMNPIGNQTRQEDGLVFGEVGAGCPRYFSRSAYPAWHGQIRWCVERKWSCALSLLPSPRPASCPLCSSVCLVCRWALSSRPPQMPLFQGSLCIFLGLGTARRILLG